MTALILADDHVAKDDAALATLGGVHAVGSVTRAQLAKARKVIVVWSRAARGTPALKAAARRAKAHGKLLCVRLDAALPPAELGGLRAVRLPHGRAGAAALKRLVRPGAARPIPNANKPARQVLTTRRATRRETSSVIAPSPPRARPARRGGAVRWAAVLTLVLLSAGAEAYARDPAFAARVQTLAESAQARAATFVQEIAR